ncbi:MAG: carbohydrate kinase [Bacteroidia bacterium]
MQSLRVVCFGETLWDLLPTGKVPGGAPMNVALHLHRMAAQVALVSRVGQDPAGDELLTYLHAHGLDTQHIQQDAQHGTGIVEVDMRDPSEVRYEIVQPVAWDYIEADAGALAQAAACDALVFGSLAARQAGSRQALDALLDATRGLVVFDVNLRPPFVDRSQIEHLLRRAGYAKLNEHEVRVLGAWAGADEEAEEEALVRAVQTHYGLRAIILTQGAQGASFWDGARLVSQPGYAVQVADTIGSGDSFLAAFLSRHLRGYGIQDSLDYACATGALVASHRGANPPISEADIQALIAARR